MKVKIKGKQTVGTYYYEKLHNDIVKQTNLLSIKKLFDDFFIDNGVNSKFVGLTITEGYVYIIRCVKNGKMYIGQSKDIVKRMHSYISTIEIGYDMHVNENLRSDIMLYGYRDFHINFIKTEDHINMEKQLITKSKAELYNIVHNKNRNNVLSNENLYKNDKYIIGDLSFRTKKEITDLCRNTLDKYAEGTYLDLGHKDAKLAISMVKLHPTYNGFLENGTDIKLKVVKDNYKNEKGIGNWNIFHFEYKIGKTKEGWSFSTKKVIDNLKK